MDSKKLERIVIVILALLNVFLLVVVLRDSAQAAQNRRETVTSLVSLLEAAGIAVGPDAELLQDCPAECTVLRDLDLEQRRIQGLLGSHTSEDLGGSIWFYSSDSGQLRMRGTGEMDMLLTSDNSTRGRTREKTAEAMFSRAGVELYALGASSGAPENAVELCCCWNGYPVYNAVLTFDYSGDRLYMVSGTMVFNTAAETGETRGMDSVSVLVRFMDLVKSEGIICSRLDALTPGYYMNVTMSGESTLTPVWRIATDTGDFYINAVSGRSESFG